MEDSLPEAPLPEVSLSEASLSESLDADFLVLFVVEAPFLDALSFSDGVSEASGVTSGVSSAFTDFSASFSVASAAFLALSANGSS